MVVVHPNEVGRPEHLHQYTGEPLIDLPIAFLILAIELHATEESMEQRPQGFIAEAAVILRVLSLGQRNADHLDVIERRPDSPGARTDSRGSARADPETARGLPEGASKRRGQTTDGHTALILRPQRLLVWHAIRDNHESSHRFPRLLGGIVASPVSSRAYHLFRKAVTSVVDARRPL